MKKLSILLLGALGMMATSCLEKVDPVAPQENAQEPILKTGDITSAKAGVLAATTPLDLQDYATSGAAIPVMVAKEVKELPEGAEVSYILQLANNEDFDHAVNLATEVNAKGEYCVPAAQWEAAHIALFGKGVEPMTAYYRVPVYVNVDGSDYRYQAVNYYAAEGTIVETRMTPERLIADSYELHFGDKVIEMSHAADVSVYDDPVFKATVDVTAAQAEDGVEWFITGSNGTTVGVEEDGDENYEGELVDKNAQKGILFEPGKFKLTVNMEEMTYTFEELLRPDYLYTPGAANGWSQIESAWMQYKAGKGYYGLFPVEQYGFKVCTEPSWDNNVTFGAETEDPALAGDFVMGSEGKNINVPNVGSLYWAWVQFDEALFEVTSYKLVEVTRVGLIGSFAASSWGSDIAMTSEDGGKTWSCEATFAAGDQFKFRFNNGWDLNFGGELDNLTFDSGNLKAEETGTFIVTLKLQPGVPTATVALKK